MAFLRSEPMIRVEPGPRSLLDTADAIRAMCAEVPGLRLTSVSYTHLDVYKRQVSSMCMPRARCGVWSCGRGDAMNVT